MQATLGEISVCRVELIHISTCKNDNKVSAYLDDSRPDWLEVYNAESLEQARSIILEHERCNCVLAEMLSGAEDCTEKTGELCRLFKDQALLLYMDGEDEDFVNTCIMKGAEDCLSLAGLSDRALFRAIRVAVLRKGRNHRQASESEKYKKMLNAMEDAVYVCSAEHTIEFMNRAAIARSGGEQLGEPCHTVLHSLNENCPWCQNEYIEERKNIVQEVTSPKDNRTYHIAYTSLQDGNSPPSQMAILREITPVRQEQERVTHLGQILDESLEEIYVFRQEDLKFSFMNQPACKNLGYSEKELRKMTPMDLILPSSRESFRETIHNLQHEKVRKSEFTTEFVRKNSKRYPVEMHLHSIRFDNTPSILAFVIDITSKQKSYREHQQMLQQMQKTQRLESLGMLAGGIAHHFNNLLMTILGNAELAIQELPESSTGGACVREIEKAGERAANLSRQMLTFSGYGKMRIQKVHISKLIKETGNLIDVSVAGDTEVQYHLTEDLPHIEVDVPQFQQVVMNLITNALESIGKDSGKITIKTFTREYEEGICTESLPQLDLPSGLYVVLEISDTGCGMNRETLDRVFDPFFSTKFTGRGLGLAAVLGIVRGHGGTMSIESKPGEGTTVSALFPALERRSENREEVLDSEKPLHGAKILVADDDESVLNVTKRILERAGCSVATAEDGAKALQYFENKEAGEDASFDCMILDIRMPKIDGKALFYKIKDQNPQLPVIISSGFGEEEVSRLFEAQRPEFIIQKPFQSSRILDMVRKALKAGRL